MKTQAIPTARETKDGLGELSVDLVFEIHQLVNVTKKVDEVHITEKRVAGKEGENRLLRLGYKSFLLGFQNGEYECTAILDSRNKLIGVRDVKDLPY